MKIRRAAIAVAAVSAGVLGIPAAASGHGYGGQDAVGLTTSGSSLVRFDTDRPERSRKPTAIRGLVGDTTLVGIDRRVQNGKLYGVGKSGGIYTVSSTSTRALKVGQLTVALDGTSFGVDFNPAANALRIISNTGQNLRQPFGTTDGPTVATVVDGPLTYPATPTAPATTASGVTGAAYTNNDLNADTATTLFDLDTNLDQVVIQSPANSGSLAATGKLGVDAGADVGFDIYSELAAGKTVSVAGFAVITVGGSSGLYSVDLLTGDAYFQGNFRSGVQDIALDLDH